MGYEAKKRQNQHLNVIDLSRFSPIKMGNGLETESIPKSA